MGADASGGGAIGAGGAMGSIGAMGSTAGSGGSESDDGAGSRPRTSTTRAETTGRSFPDVGAAEGSSGVQGDGRAIHRPRSRRRVTNPELRDLEATRDARRPDLDQHRRAGNELVGVRLRDDGIERQLALPFDLDATEALLTLEGDHRCFRALRHERENRSS